MAGITDTLKDAGNKMMETAGKAAEWVKDKAGMGPEVAGGADPCMIRPHMAVFSCCGHLVGKVDHLEGGAIKLTRSDSPDCQHHYIPTGWVARVDENVHLNKNADEARREWKSDAASCSGCCGT